MTAPGGSAPSGTTLRGPKAPPAGSVRDWLDRRADETPDAVSHLFADGAPPLTWAALREEAAEIAARLAGRSVRRGESVALCLANGRPAILCLFGALYGGFRATPLNLAAGPAAIGYALGHSRAPVAFVGAAEATLFAAARAEVEADPEAEGRPIAIPVDDAIRWPDDARAAAEAAREDDDALLMYTSGTTGRPKGVVHSQASLLAGGWTTKLAHRLGPHDRALCVLPFFHINGLCVTLMAPLVSGGSVIVAARFSVSAFWDWADRYEATWASVVPTIISHLIHDEREPTRAARRRLRFVRSASAPLAVETHRAFEDRFRLPIVETMGLTETAAQILSNPLPPGLRKIGSPGFAFGNEATILAAGAPVPRGTSGEIAVRGPNVMRGYLRDGPETAAAFAPGGWLLTGDLGRMDDDGYVFVEGRRKELIIKGGENIAPREVDEALYLNPHVVEAAAFARPCPTYGQRVEAAVALDEDGAATEAALRALCVERLGPFKAPDRVHFLTELPKGPSGKIQRLKLAELLEERLREAEAVEKPA